jgi:hypothetical protein
MRVCLKRLPFIPGAGSLSLLLAALLLPVPAPAQDDYQPPARWLLIFDTSIAMQHWLPGTTTALQNLFFNNISGQLRAGDSVGVWTFDEKLRPAQYPLFLWQPQNAADEASRLINFLDFEHYSGRTRFKVLQPLLGRVIANSPRLTIVIFCDGKDKLKLTPYDDGINHVFEAMLADRKKIKVPFVVVIRTQNGKFVGATVNLPPGSVDLPVFPPLPQPVEAVPTNPPPGVWGAVASPTASPPPLVIVGTNVITNADDIKKISGP